MGYNKRDRISYITQANILRKRYPTSLINSHRNGFKWCDTITPSTYSNSYRVELTYNTGEHPKVIVKTPLELANGETRLPHVYNHEKQHLCLYHKPSNEWTSNLLIADTIIPWTTEWLFFYEFWLANGDWYGGGIGHAKKKPIIKK